MIVSYHINNLFIDVIAKIVRPATFKIVTARSYIFSYIYNSENDLISC